MDPDRLDALEDRLVEALQRDATLSAEQLATLCHASAPTVYRRLKRLRARGVIRGQVAVVNEQYVSRPLKVLVEVTLTHQDQVSQNAFQRAMIAAPEVTQCRMITGETDYILEAHFRSNREINTFIDGTLSASSKVLKYRTLVVMKEVKLEPALSY